MKSEERAEDGATVLRILESAVDINNIGEFRDLLDERGRETKGALVLDLSELQYIGSVGLGAVSLASIAMAKAGRGFGVVVASDEVRRVFKVANLHRLISLTDSVQAALGRLR